MRQPRAGEEYAKNPEGFATDFTIQDAAILNVQRACEACIDMASHIVRRDRLGMPNSARDAFVLLRNAGLIDANLQRSLGSMVGFRNIAIHQYVELSIDETVRVITRGLDDCLAFAAVVLKSMAPPPAPAPEQPPSASA